MTILLYGKDEYRRDLKKREIIREFQAKHPGEPIGNFDLKQDGAEAEFISFTEGQSLFTPVKLAVVEGVFAKKSKKIDEKIKSGVGSSWLTLVIVESDKPAKAYEFLLKKPSAEQLFEPLKGFAWLEFVRKEVSREDIALDKDAFELLARAYEGDTWRLVTELKKLRSLTGETIKTSDLRELGVELTPDFWELVQGWRNPSWMQRLTALERCFASNEPAGKIFNILAYQLKTKLPQMAAYDLMVKSGKLDYEEVLVDLALAQ